MRILYHHRTQAEDGQAVHIRSLIRAFEAQGHDVFEVGLVKHGREDRALPTPEEPKEGDRAGGKKSWSWVTRLPRFMRELAEYGYNGLARRRIVGAAARFEPDFLYERYAFGNAAGVLAARRTKLPLMLEVNSPMVLELERTRGLSFPDFARKIEHFIFRSADRVCVVTGVLRDMLLDMGVAAERLLVVPNGVHLDQYAYADRAAARDAARLDLGLAEGTAQDELVLGFVGYYRAWHRLDLVLRALAAPQLAHAHLVLIGEGPAREELEREADSRGVRDRVHFAGPRKHGRIPALLPAFDIALVPAINPYASPLKLHEYMAASLPVIAPDQPNLREVLQDGENALLVQAGEADELEGALHALAADAALREKLGTAARRTIEERDLTWTGNAKRVIEAMRGLS